ncbi:MAG TPA: NAAT family transporter [Methanomassiliicoccales archaeon]|jgi:multiple antibiotic resistance protein|nr:MarC family protein [Euryarchaeota archaeon]HOE53076.1 NAAT family transporter [Methanomassiliicoccales archaeon]HOO03380.1 NAAT family transporter [Methanomassiliicoccales archaeon]HPD08288.1 NAAT family transporter [Methanomassiliicoccales archaeon]HQM67215.1 NAAT family transporter [Methanomassiliicoccales archaeon]
MDLAFAVTAFASIFAVMNPVGNLPVFVAITEGYSPELKRKVRNKVCIVAGSVLVVFALFGNVIFDLYGITIPAFKIAGGILLFSIAFTMTRGQLTKSKMTEEEAEEASEKEEVGVVPLGIPLFAGPGAITTVMIYVSYAQDSGEPTLNLLFLFLGIFATVAISFVLLKYAEPLFSRMGKSGAMAFTRIMGLLLAAMAVEFVLSGTFEAVSNHWGI